MPDIRFTKGHKGRKRAVAGETSAPPSVPGGAVPRLSRLMALAIRFDRLLQEGVVKDHAELARLGQVTRARLPHVTRVARLADQNVHPEWAVSPLQSPRTQPSS